MCTSRADVVGSLLRPHYLSEARAAFEAGGLRADESKRVEERAVDQAITLQEGAGLDVVTDGEMRRFSFFDQLTSAVDGLSHIPAKPVPFHSADGNDINFESPETVTAKLTRKKMLTPTEFAYTSARARKPVKIAVLGLVSTKTDELEDREQLLARIEEAARFYPKDQLAVSTQCGFASVAMGNEISERTQEDKLRLVAETAERAYG
jgi:methionine synthase II (cobalamin-independent)